jgi:2-octaprenyl-3-methyl-6-methoxy-1,4-benzoquinol hydroxylase
MTRESTDILVSGGGMVGASAAVALAQAGNRVQLLERRRPSPWQSNGPRRPRVSALSLANIRWLQETGIWQHVDTDRLGIYRAMRVWDARSGRQLGFQADLAREPALGMIIENDNLVQAAWQQLSRLSPVDVRVPAEIEAMQEEGGRLRVAVKTPQANKNEADEVNEKEECLSRLLVAADGAASRTRALAGIDTTAQTYGQKGIVAYVKLSGAPAETAMQAFAEGGPVGLLPVSTNGLFSIVWSVPEARAEALLSCSEGAFEDTLEGVINHPELGFSMRVELCGERLAFPLRRQMAAEFVKGRVALAGDAAHVVHPLAGQGVNLGLQDVAELARQLQGIDWRDQASLNLALRRYQRRRYSQARETSALMTAINHAFRDDVGGKRWLRSALMQGVEAMPPLKHWFMRQAGS